MTRTETDALPPSSPCLQGEHVTFTGTLASMTHRQASQLAEEHGGTAAHHVSGLTTMLVIGEEGWPLEIDGQPSRKLVQVQLLEKQGQAVRILSESEWLQLIGLNQGRHQVQRNYTPAMLSRLLNVPVNRIRSWERHGLIRPVRRVYRLPYFSFQEVTSARKLSELLDRGVPYAEIKASLESLGTALGNTGRPLAQLDLLACDATLAVRDTRGLLQPSTGQRLLDFEPPEPDDASRESVIAMDSAADSEPLLRSAAAWFEEGCRLADGDALPEATQAFRLSLMERAGDAEVHFHLADALYRSGNVWGALERYYAAVEQDCDYLEAWTQLGCVLAETDDADAATDAFRIALELHPGYADAHWHLASVLDRLGDRQGAAEHWQQYLDLEDQGAWADDARRRLAAVSGAPAD